MKNLKIQLRSGSSNIGIYMQLGSDITSTGTGVNAATITFNGTGGNGPNNNYGVYIRHSNTAISAVDGNISITGTGRSNGAHRQNYGLFLDDGASVISTGTGAGASTITLNGTGGDGTTSNIGVYLISNGANISSVDGDIAITGTGGNGSSNGNDGIRIQDTSTVTSTGLSNITLTGTKGANASFDIRTVTGANVIGGGGALGDITLNFDEHSLANLNVQTSGSITLQPRSNATTIGVAGGAGTLDLDATVLGFMNWGGTLHLGSLTGDGAMDVQAHDWTGRSVDFRSNTGVITVGGAQTNLDDFTLQSNVDPVVGFGVTGTGNLTLQPVSVATTMGVAGAAGTFALSAAELGQFGTGWTDWSLGRTDGTGTLSVDAHSWADPVIYRAAAAGNIAVNGLQDTTAASDATFTFSGPATLSANLDTSAATGGTRNITFNNPVTLGANAQLLAGSGNIAFADTLDGAFDLDVSTTGNATFTGAVGGVTPLADVTLNNIGTLSGAAFDAGSFTLTGGTGTVGFTGAGLTTTGDINLATNNNITGTYNGVNGVLDAGAGAVNATVSFTTLDIDGAAATLSAGSIGAPGPASQSMANLISIGGIIYPALVADPNYTYDAFIIGASVPPPPAGGSRPTPVETVSIDVPTPDSGTQSGGDTVTSPSPAAALPAMLDTSRIEKIAQITTAPPTVTATNTPVASTGPDSRPNASLSIQQENGEENTLKLEQLAPASSEDAASHDYSRLITYSHQLLKQLGCLGGGAASCSTLK